MSKHSPQNQPRRGEGVCIYCGNYGEITADHVFPQSLFLELDKSMLTVPACKTCQRLKGLGDADLEIFANLHIMGSTHPDSAGHIDKIRKRNQRTEEFLNNLAASAEARAVVTPSGTRITDAFISDYDSSRIITSLTMAAKGLYFNTNATVLGPQIDSLAEIVPWSAFYPLIKLLAPYRKDKIEIKGNNVVWWSEISIETSSPSDSLYVACINDKILILLATGEIATKLKARLKKINITKNRDAAVLKYQPSSIKVFPDQLPDS